MGDLEDRPLGLSESPLGYHPCNVEVLTTIRDQDLEQCQVGSLTGAVTSKRVTEVPKGSLSAVGNRAKSVKAEGSLTARHTGRAGQKCGLSDPVVFRVEGPSLNG